MIGINNKKTMKTKHIRKDLRKSDSHPKYGIRFIGTLPDHHVVENTHDSLMRKSREYPKWFFEHRILIRKANAIRPVMMAGLNETMRASKKLIITPAVRKAPSRSRCNRMALMEQGVE